MKVDVKVSLVNEDGERFMGAGPVLLLQGIRRSRSISEAAREMELSYAKAHRILKRLERNLGQSVISRWMGGSERGGADLTPFGEEFLEQFDRLQKKIKVHAEEEFVGFLQSRKGPRGR